MVRQILFFLSLCIVALGQRAWFWPFGLLTASVGFALFWYATWEGPARTRFWKATLWFTTIQAFQLSWTLSHPYLYMVIIYTLVAFSYGVQFGLLSYFIDRRVRSTLYLFSLSGLWVFLEWMRLFFLPKLSWNPVGLSLAVTNIGSQLASIGGVFLLSFIVILTNLFFLRYLIDKQRSSYLAYCVVLLLPFAFGVIQLYRHDLGLNQSQKLPVLLVQTGADVVQKTQFASLEAYRRAAMQDWENIVLLIKKTNAPLELVVLPENALPFSAYQAAYPFEEVHGFFADHFDTDALMKLPAPHTHLGLVVEGRRYVNNAYWAQAIANLFNTHLIVGMEDRDEGEKEVKHYSAALLFQPHYSPFQRYAKRILVPMGEYIPFEWCRELCKRYGIHGSFTPGEEANLLYAKEFPIGVSICYEETFGHLMRESRQNGAQLHVNLTNDGWYPGAHLPLSHFEHARLRAIEQGIPMVRACNTGLTSVVDSTGQTVAALVDEKGNVKESSGALYAEVPLYQYPTPYTKHGDFFVLGLSAISIFLSGCCRKRKLP